MLLESKIWLDASFSSAFTTLKQTHWTGTWRGTLYSGLEYLEGYELHQGGI